MTGNKNFFRNVFDAMIDARSKQAAREIAMYQNTFSGVAGEKTPR